jgi:hypothetical protein
MSVITLKNKYYSQQGLSHNNTFSLNGRSRNLRYIGKTFPKPICCSIESLFKPVQTSRSVMTKQTQYNNIVAQTTLHEHVISDISYGGSPCNYIQDTNIKPSSDYLAMKRKKISNCI